MMTSVSDLTRNENKIYDRYDLHIVLRSNMHLQSIYFAVLHWGGFATQWGDKKCMNGADDNIHNGADLSACINWAEFRNFFALYQWIFVW